MLITNEMDVISHIRKICLDGTLLKQPLCLTTFIYNLTRISIV